MSDKSPTTSHKGRDKEESLQSPRKSNTDHLKRDSSMMGLLSLKKSFSKLRSGGKSPEKTSPSESQSRAKSPRGSSANLKGERSSHNRSSGNLKPSITSPSESPSRAKSPRGSSANLKGERSSHNRSSGNLKPSITSPSESPSRAKSLRGSSANLKGERSSHNRSSGNLKPSITSPSESPSRAKSPRGSSANLKGERSIHNRSSGNLKPSITSPSESPSKAKSLRGSSANLKGERSIHNRSSGNLKPSAESSRKCSPSQAGDAKLQRGVLPSYGRRSGQGNSGAETPKQKNDWFTSDEARPKDRVVKNLERVSDGVDEDVNEKKDRERKHRESLLNKVSEAPTDYYPTMPQLADLDITNTWNKLLESIHQEFDMSCLTACLATELDEDIPWNPEMVLVQLTSDMLDAAELKADGTMSSALDADDNTIGSMQGGEVTRKRKEKDVSGQGSTEGKDKKHGGRSPGAQDKANENRSGSRNDSRASGSRGNRIHDTSGAQGNRRSPSRHGSRKSVKHSFRGREEYPTKS